MKIQLDNAGKRYNRDWIFRNITYTFQPQHSYAITGPNGSGKSTLLQILSGAVMINEGSCSFFVNECELASEKIYTKISYCAPYLELVEEFTLMELFHFHQSFKPFIANFTPDTIAEIVGLGHVKNKKISEFSSGMKQRAKLAQCVFSDTPAILLDEPCTNLDSEGVQLYVSLIEKYCSNRLVLVSSNDTTEYSFCKELIDITKYK